MNTKRQKSIIVFWLIVLTTGIFSSVFSAQVTITRSGAAVSYFKTSYKEHHFSSNYSSGIVLGEDFDESKAVYEFYIPGDDTSNPLATSITVNIYGSGTITNLAVGSAKGELKTPGVFFGGLGNLSWVRTFAVFISLFDIEDPPLEDWIFAFSPFRLTPFALHFSLLILLSLVQAMNFKSFKSVLICVNRWLKFKKSFLLSLFSLFY